VTPYSWADEIEKTGLVVVSLKKRTAECPMSNYERPRNVSLRDADIKKTECLPSTFCSSVFDIGYSL